MSKKQEHGRTPAGRIPGYETKTFHMRPELKQRIKLQAALEGLTEYELAEKVWLQYFERYAPNGRT